MQSDVNTSSSIWVQFKSIISFISSEKNHLIPFQVVPLRTYVPPLTIFPRDQTRQVIPKAMFERYLNVLFALLWTFQLVDSLFLACRIRLGNPTKAFVALKVTAFTDNRPIYIHLNSICVFHRTDTLTHKSNSRSFLQNCY